LMVTLYLLANMAADLGWFAWVRFLSPFFYFHQSQALIPGHSIDLAATAILVIMSTSLVVAGLVAFDRRDLSAALWPRSAAAVPVGPNRAPVQTIWRGDAWIADLRSQWLSLLLWAVVAGVLMVLMVSVAGKVTTVWEQSDLIRRLFLRLPGMTFLDQYMGYVTVLAALAPVAFVVTEVSRWVADINEGRVEALLAVSGSRTRVILEWAASATAGMVIVTLGVIAGCLVGAVAAGVDLRADGLVRTGSDAVLLGLGTIGIGLLAVVAFRSGVAVGGLGALLGAGFFISVLAPLFNLPDWVVHLSPFDAFGTPYATVPRPSGLALMGGMAILGTAAAVFVARWRSALAR
jgi:ABC-2 type transport system permease protein